MGSIFDFNGIENCEQAIRKTWDEFRECLATGAFSYDEIEKAKEQKFLMAYDDLFHKHSGIEQSTIVFKDLKDKLMGRGAILKNDEIPNYDRFLPKEEYIKEDNRFSPPHVEWLYLAVGNDNDIHECAQAECRAKRGNMFGFCHFQRDTKYDMCKLVDLTIADDVSYVELNTTLEKYVQVQTKKIKKIIKKCLHFSFYRVILDKHGSLVKRLRRRPLTAESGVRFPYELLCYFYNSPTRNARNIVSGIFKCFFQ